MGKVVDNIKSELARLKFMDIFVKIMSMLVALTFFAFLHNNFSHLLNWSNMHVVTKTMLILAILMLFVPLCVLVFSKMPIKLIWNGTHWCIKYIVIFILLSVVVFLIYLEVTLVHPSYKEENGFNYFDDSVVFSILTLVGIFLTLAGLFLAYKQLKMSEDRINGYEDLYEAIKSLFDDKRKTKFHFMGPTIIPGHLTFGYNKSHKEIIDKYIIDIIQVPVQENFVFITLHEDVMIENYNEYYNKYKEINPKNAANIEIEKEINLLKDVMHAIKQKTTICSRDYNISESFYFSNGHTVIYVTPLHREMSLDEIVNPELIGFKTSDRAIVKAFDNKFREAKEKIEINKIIDYIMEKSIKNNIEEFIEKLFKDDIEVDKKEWFIENNLQIIKSDIKKLIIKKTKDDKEKLIEKYLKETTENNTKNKKEDNKEKLIELYFKVIIENVLNNIKETI